MKSYETNTKQDTKNTKTTTSECAKMEKGAKISAEEATAYI
jgi:hypothetical protein